MPRLAGLTLVLVLCASALCADEAAEISEQIAALASPQWPVREKAQRRLVAIGEPAREKLRLALDHDDLEVRSRASAALIEIGENLEFALECTKAEKASLRDHGKAALMNLFRLDAQGTLSRVMPDEMYGYGNYGRRRDSSLAVSAPPVIALATAEALSGFPLLVGTPVKASWTTVLQAASITFDFSNGVEQAVMVAAQYNEMINRVVGGQDVANRQRPVALSMRIGQQEFIYVTTLALMNDAAAGAAEQLVADFVLGQEARVKAARLLAAGLLGDPAQFTKLMEQYKAGAAASPLALVALHGDADAARQARVLEGLKGHVGAMLASSEWTVLETAARLLAMLPESVRMALLDPILVSSADSLPFLVALWCARGGVLSDAARARTLDCVTNKQDGISAAAARWFAGAKTVSDVELTQIWKAAESMAPQSAFLLPALELIARDDIKPRLVDRAREALTRNFETQLALAAAVLRGLATAQDLALAVERLWNLNNFALVGRLCMLFEGAKELPEAALNKVVDGLCDNDANRRRRFMRVLRRCEPQLRATLVAQAEKKIAGITGQAASSLGVRSSRLALAGLKAGAGDATALDEVLAACAGTEAEIIKAAAAALVDALGGEALNQTLAGMKKRNAAKFSEVATAVGMEQCRRAMEEDDAEAFRVAESRVNALQGQNYNWQLMQELQQMAMQLSGSADSPLSRLLPANPRLSALNVNAK